MTTSSLFICCILSSFVACWIWSWILNFELALLTAQQNTAFLNYFIAKFQTIFIFFSIDLHWLKLYINKHSLHLFVSCNRLDGVYQKMVELVNQFRMNARSCCCYISIVNKCCRLFRKSSYFLSSLIVKSKQRTLDFSISCFHHASFFRNDVNWCNTHFYLILYYKITEFSSEAVFQIRHRLSADGEFGSSV